MPPRRKVNLARVELNKSSFHSVRCMRSVLWLRLGDSKGGSALPAALHASIINLMAKWRNGRRTRLKIEHRKVYGFKSHLRY